MTLLRADARRLPLADGVAHCCVTSPPYWGLRDYGVAGQLGLESTPAEYVAEMVSVFREVRRVLRDDGTLWLNIGDSYAQGGRGGIGDASTLQGGRHNQNESRVALKASARRDKADVPEIRGRTDHGLKPKDMLGMPWRVAFALQADGWWLRSDIIWSKPSPMPEAVTDRPTKAHEYLFLLSKSERYAYDARAIAEPVTGGAHARGGGVNPKSSGKNETTGDRRKDGFNERWRVKQNASFSAAVSDLVDRRNRRTVWTIASEPCPEAHFAVMPTALVKPCILAGSPGGGLVLDPFIGSGTVGRVAEDLGRRWIGCDLSAAYLDIASRRTAQLGMIL